MTNNDDFDQILDDALAEYREVEPLAGLEGRVFQRLRLQTERRRKFWWRWSTIAAAAAAVAIAAWIGFSGRVRHELVPMPGGTQKQMGSVARQAPDTDTRAANRELAAPPSRETRSVHPRGYVPTSTQAVATARAPVPAQFPSAAPLQPEERVLLALAQTHPELLRELSRDENDQEISIAPINIKPLAVETGDGQGEN
jgi:hypothetical protein